MNHKIPALCTLAVMIIAGIFVTSAINETDAETVTPLGDFARGSSFLIDSEAEEGVLTYVGIRYCLNESWTYISDYAGSDSNLSAQLMDDNKVKITVMTTAKLGQYKVYAVLWIEEASEDTGSSTYSFNVANISSYTHTVKYNANGGTGSMSDTVVTDTNSGSSNVTLASNSFSKSGYRFTGWKVGTTVYQPGTPIAVSGNASVTAVAQWEAITYTHTIVYSGNGNTGGSMSNTVITNTVSGSSNVTLASNSFVKTGYHFIGWKIGTTVYQPGQTVSVNGNASVTATAQWEANSLTIKTIGTQYVVVGKNVAFSVSTISEPSGASISYAKSNVSSGLNVTISGSTITCSAATAGTYTFTLTASASGFQSDSRTVTVVVVPVLAFANTPAIGVIGA